ncbi:universal stress protein [Actinosynnema sp. NPDC053489]|uniref:universal stress protein n=1 Tax=Actinosynnema sp. NPDC053489 TaxID=3363916 RepID=UPI0037C6ECB9
MSAPIVVGVDGSDTAVEAAGWAAAEAARHRVPLKLVHAYVLPTHSYPELVLTGPEVQRAFETQGRQWLDDVAGTVRAVAPEVETSLVVAPPTAALIAESRTARLVVVGSRGLGGFSGLLVGSVAVAVSTHGACPVVVVRDPAPGDGPVVVGVDGSPVSEEAIAFAFEEASLRDAPLTAVLAWTDFQLDSPFGSWATVDWSQVEADQRQLLAERLAGWQERYPDVRVDRRVVRGGPARALLQAARDARLLVVGSRGRGGFTGMLLGSTSQSLVYHATCPLAVVRPRHVTR